MTRKQEIALEIDHLKQQLQERERERAELWSGAFWLWFLFWPVLVYKCVKKANRGSKLDIEIRDLRDRIKRLERESWELERK